METSAATKITVQIVVDAPVDRVWKAFTDPKDIVQWNAASDDWHTTKATNDLTVGGIFSSTMAAKDGSMSFDFSGKYSRVDVNSKIEYALGDARVVSISFSPVEGGADKTEIVETFDAEGTHTIEQQQFGWQAILNNFKTHVEASP